MTHCGMWASGDARRMRLANRIQVIATKTGDVMRADVPVLRNAAGMANVLMTCPGMVAPADVRVMGLASKMRAPALSTGRAQCALARVPQSVVGAVTLRRAMNTGICGTITRSC